MPTPALERLLQHPAIFRAGHIVPRTDKHPVSTGYPELDRTLPWGGWPPGRLIEILPAHEAIGELTLLTPALAHVAREGRMVVFADPPYLPYAPALVQHGLPLDRLLVTRGDNARDVLWGTEQCLRSGVCGVVLAWEQTCLAERNLRRLQLAAETGDSLAFLLRAPCAARRSSPAGLRIALAAKPGALTLTILKGRGASGTSLTLALPSL